MDAAHPDSHRRRLLLAAAASFAVPPAVGAATPPRRLRLVVPYPAGGGPDSFVRLLADELARRDGSRVIVENRPGASGLLGARSVSQGKTDGADALFVTGGHVTLAAINPRFDLLRELRPVIRLSASPFVVVVREGSPIQNMSDLIRAVQGNPGRLSFGSAGTGSPAHMAVELLDEATGNFKALHVPFKGAQEAMYAIVGGQVDFTIGVLGSALPHIGAGRLRALAVTTASRLRLLPGVPAIAEFGATDYVYQSWGGLMVHAKAPADVVERLATEAAKAMQAEGVRRYLSTTGSHMDLSESPAAFAAQIRRDLAAERAIVKRLGIVSP